MVDSFKALVEFVVTLWEKGGENAVQIHRIVLVNPLCAFAASSTLPKNVLSHASHPVSVHTALKTHDAFLLLFFFALLF